MYAFCITFGPSIAFHSPSHTLSLSRSSDSPPDATPPLSTVQTLILALRDVRALLHDFLGFGEDEFDVAGV